MKQDAAIQRKHTGTGGGAGLARSPKKPPQASFDLWAPVGGRQLPKKKDRPPKSPNRMKHTTTTTTTASDTTTTRNTYNPYTPFHTTPTPTPGTASRRAVSPPPPKTPPPPPAPPTYSDNDIEVNEVVHLKRVLKIREKNVAMLREENGRLREQNRELEAAKGEEVVRLRAENARLVEANRVLDNEKKGTAGQISDVCHSLRGNVSAVREQLSSEQQHCTDLRQKLHLSEAHLADTQRLLRLAQIRGKDRNATPGGEHKIDYFQTTDADIAACRNEYSVGSLRRNDSIRYEPTEHRSYQRREASTDRIHASPQTSFERRTEGRAVSPFQDDPLRRTSPEARQPVERGGSSTLERRITSPEGRRTASPFGRAEGNSTAFERRNPEGRRTVPFEGDHLRRTDGDNTFHPVERPSTDGRATSPFEGQRRVSDEMRTVSPHRRQGDTHLTHLGEQNGRISRSPLRDARNLHNVNGGGERGASPDRGGGGGGGDAMGERSDRERVLRSPSPSPRVASSCTLSSSPPSSPPFIPATSDIRCAVKKHLPQPFTAGRTPLYKDHL